MFLLTRTPDPRIPPKYQTCSVMCSLSTTVPPGKKRRMLQRTQTMDRGSRLMPRHLAKPPEHISEAPEISSSAKKRRIQEAEINQRIKNTLDTGGMLQVLDMKMSLESIKAPPVGLSRTQSMPESRIRSKVLLRLVLLALWLRVFGGTVRGGSSRMDSSFSFSSRRSPVLSLRGCSASSQPLASAAGLDILKRGGNAADAAVAMAAALALTEPCSTGPGGDAFCLFYDGNTGEIRGINGSGRSPRALSLDFLEGRGFSADAPPSPFDALNVTVPGAPACWCDTVQMFGSQKLSLQEVLRGPVELAEEGFPVSEVAAHHWANWVCALREDGKELGGDLLVNGHPPKAGQVFRNPALARTLRELGERGKPAFYQGRVARAIVDAITQHGGVMTLEDLSSHDSEVVSPISTDYKGVCLWEPPPNSQGLAALLLLNILEDFPLKALGHNSSDYIHVLVEAVRLALTDSMHYLGDPDHVTVPVETLLDKSYSRRRAQHISMDRAMEGAEPGLMTGSDTVYFCVIDSQGNACSFVNSTFMGFGSGLVPEDCGFSLQNRGACFSLRRSHVNQVSGGKRPYHTIIPALLTDSAVRPQKPRLLAALGVMGAFMQPQGHVQVLLNLLEFGMNPQRALDAPRVFVQHDSKTNQWLVNLEEGVDQEVAEELRRRGHKVNWPITGHRRSQFGRGQIITVGDWWNPSSGSQAEDPVRVLWAGSDPRGDGCAQGH